MYIRQQIFRIFLGRNTAEFAQHTPKLGSLMMGSALTGVCCRFLLTLKTVNTRNRNTPLPILRMSSYSRGSSGNGRRCHCGLPLTRARSWTKDNPGRRFVACSDYDAETNKRGCKYFKWVDDEEQTEWQRQVILGLLEDKRMLCNEVQELKQRVTEANTVARKLNSDCCYAENEKKRVSICFKCELWVIFALATIVLAWFVIRKQAI